MLLSLTDVPRLSQRGKLSQGSKIASSVVDHPQSSHSIPYCTFTSIKLIKTTRRHLTIRPRASFTAKSSRNVPGSRGPFTLSAGDARLSTAQALQESSLCNRSTTNHPTCTTDPREIPPEHGFKLGCGLIECRTSTGEAVQGDTDRQRHSGDKLRTCGKQCV